MLHKLLAKHSKIAKRSISLLLCLVLLLSTRDTMVAFATTEDTAGDPPSVEDTIPSDDPDDPDETPLDEEEPPEEEVDPETSEAPEETPAEDPEEPAEEPPEDEEDPEGELLLDLEDDLTVNPLGSGVSTIADSNEVTVYVYVAGSDPVTGEAYSDEMLSLLNISTRQSDGYYAVGTITVDTSLLSGSYSSALKTAADWEIILEALKDLNTSASLTEPNNNIKDYLDMIIQDLGGTASSNYSGMWVVSGSPTSYNWSSDGRVYYNGNKAGLINLGTHAWHLDLRFSAVTITYKYGNNGLSTDGTTAGSKVFIEGATMDYTPTIEAPSGYKIVGYYSDPECTVEWNAVNQPINEDTTVYIKKAEERSATVSYQVAEGEGAVSVANESFNPTTGSAQGSTATAAIGWKFVGWYSDAECTQLVSKDPEFVPTTPTDGWEEGKDYTYYAKFIENTVTVDLTKIITGNMADLTKSFSFAVTYTNADGTEKTKTITLGNNEEAETLTVIMNSTVTITEQDYGSYTVTATVNGDAATVGDGTLTFTASENTSVVVTNTYNVTPETGILLDATPYILLLCAAVLSMILLHSKRKRV